MNAAPLLTLDQLNAEQQEAVRLIRSGDNILVSGKAGTGKSVLLRYLSENLEQFHITASTGISALNVGGCTIHSWAALGVGEDSAKQIATRLLDRKNSVWYSICKAKAIAIDEVSMISDATLDKLDEVLRIVRKSTRPFGGIQVITFGDFCLKVGTKVVMHDGSLKNVEDVNIGEHVMGPDSKPRKVLRLFRGFSDLYKVQQANGDSYVVTGNHRLVLKRRGNHVTHGRRVAGRTRLEWKRFPNTPDTVVLTPKEYLEKSAKFKECYGGYKAGCIQIPERPLKLDPYFLGMWLGDGEKDNVRITSADPEILRYCQEYGAKVGLMCKWRKERENTPAIRISITTGRTGLPGKNILKETLRSYGVLGNKHIPKDFLLNSESNRLKLLAGLIDTDGCWSGNRFIYATTLEVLAQNVKQLVDHLGFRAMMRRNSADTAWEITIGGDTWRIPTLIKRKQSHPRVLGRSRLNSTLRVSFEGSGEFAGFETNGDRLFLLADGTVTHNCQLPPVGDRGMPARFAFESKAWKDAKFRVVMLKRVMRQANERFAEILSRVREGDVSEEVRDFLRPRINAVDPDPTIKPVVLMTHNADADAENIQSLMRLEPPEWKFEANDWAVSEHQRKALDRDCIAPKTLLLRKGAQVMLLWNMLELGLANGSVGIVEDVVEREQPIPIVKFPGIDQPVEIEPRKWKTIRHKEEVASREQIPLRLAYAITIHKSQGMSLSKVEVSLARCFAPGQAYVALSRARTLEGLYIRDIKRSSISAHPDALKFYRNHAVE